MPDLELPHTPGCLVCGRDNPLGLRLSLFVEPITGTVRTTATPGPQHIGFEGVVHGGWIATVCDEAMVWAAIWASRRSCLAAELSVRFKQKAVIDSPLEITATVETSDRRLIETSCQFATADGIIIATAVGKYVPGSSELTAAFFKTLVGDASTREAATVLQSTDTSDPSTEVATPPVPVQVLDYQTDSSATQLQAIARFSDEFHANMALLCLEGEAIEASVQGHDGVLGPITSQIHLLVPKIDVARAKEILMTTPARPYLFPF